MNTTNLKKVLKKRILLSSILALTLIMLLLSGYVNNYLWIIPFIAFIIPISKLFEYWLIYKRNNIDDKVRKILKNRVILNFVLVINLALALLGKYSDNYTLYFACFLLVFIPIGEIQDYWEIYKKN